jgi:putative SOS response-associated peptidase YedK
MELATESRGLLPHDTEDPANALRPIMARVDSVATHSMFASTFRHRRATIPMLVYYQRRSISGSKRLFAISRRDGEMMAVAGLWETTRRPAGRMPGSPAQVSPCDFRLNIVTFSQL